MSSYLEAYGAAEARHERRIRIVKIASLTVACALIAGLILYGMFRNYREEQQAKNFIALLRAHDYQRAYQLWCPSASACPAYPFNKFLDDWGQQSAHADESSAHIGSTESCGS